jgi:hypothetical protein
MRPGRIGRSKSSRGDLACGNRHRPVVVPSKSRRRRDRTSRPSPCPAVCETSASTRVFERDRHVSIRQVSRFADSVNATRGVVQGGQGQDLLEVHDPSRGLARSDHLCFGCLPLL